MRDIRVASVQFEHINGDKQANLATIARYTQDAAESGAEIVVFPECCITGYWFLNKLSKDELPEGPRRNFDRVDRDGDGVISLAEHDAFVENCKDLWDRVVVYDSQ